ncbi:hypothetical protein EKG39_19555 [Shewanella atlantica]|uniref:Glycosyltransferase family 1 protein n=2 Tax=Shewanella atlantica TaxID=271099 RepID=A0A3S0I8X9_9GAMM|nr:hypothetical protein EKG39_19555 [Shewanella atlantica]
MLLSPKFLFVPVSSAEGIGEYMRSKIIADEVAQHWPEAQIEFVLNSNAPYIHSCPYKIHLVDDSPTKKIREVNELMTELSPDIVIFDAAGRKAQLKHAKKLGAKVIFISQHRRKRSRGMKVERALVTDSHWVVQPEFVIGDITRFDKFKLDLIDRPHPIFTGAVFPQPDKELQQKLQQEFDLVDGDYLLYSAGSGSHHVKNGLAADLWAEVAQKTYQQFGIKSVMVFGPNYPHPLPELDGVIAVLQLTSIEFINLLQGAKASVLSGGDTLLQSMALGIPSLVVPVAKDQPNRIKKCYEAGWIHTSKPQVDAMCKALSSLLTESKLVELKDKYAQCSLENGLNIVMSEIERLLVD